MRTLFKFLLRLMPLRWLKAWRDALKGLAMSEHQRAAGTSDPQRAAQIRSEADWCEDQAEQIHSEVRRRWAQMNTSGNTRETISAAEKAHVSYNRIDISDRTFAIIASTLAIVSMLYAWQAEREAKLAREDFRVVTIALARHGIDTDEHAEEKGPDNVTPHHHQ